MTEVEWLACEDPRTLFQFLRNAVSDRKCRLFAHACCKRIAHRFIDPSQHLAVHVVERLADGSALVEEIETAASAVKRFDAAYFDANRPRDEVGYPAAAVVAQALLNRPLEELMRGPELHWLDEVIWGTVSAAGEAVLEAEQAAGRVYDESPDEVPDLRRGQRAEERVLSGVFREILGNPFRPVTFSPEWRTDTVLTLARQMYESRDFSAMPILADALQDAGCDNEDVLNHCRGNQEGVSGEPAEGSPVRTGPHVRGCWAIDLVLEKP
jgi:hypothetical protein